MTSAKHQEIGNALWVSEKGLILVRDGGVNVKVFATVDSRIAEDGKTTLVRCDCFRLQAEGKHFDDARAHLQKLLTVHLQWYCDRGTLGQILTDPPWKRRALSDSVEMLGSLAASGAVVSVQLRPVGAAA